MKKLILASLVVLFAAPVFANDVSTPVSAAADAEVIGEGSSGLPPEFSGEASLDATWRFTCYSRDAYGNGFWGASHTLYGARVWALRVCNQRSWGCRLTYCQRNW